MKKINIKVVLEEIILILSSLIVFANANIISNHVGVISWLMFVLSLVYVVMFNRGVIKNKILYIFGFTIVFLMVHSLFSYDIRNSYRLMKFYVFFYIFLFVNHSENSIATFFDVVKKIIIFGAITIVISPMIDNFVLNYFSFFVKANPVRIMGELSENTYSGIFSEKGNAAFLLNIGIALIGSKFLSNDFKNNREKKVNVVEIFILFIALILTNKRALLVFPIIIFGFIYLFIKDKNKILKILKFLFPALILFVILINCFPVMGTVFDRFINDDDNHRSELKMVCVEMNHKRPLFGFGINTYNQYAYDIGFRLNVYGSGDTDGIWRYHAHNIYYQLLGEVGYLGLLIIIFTFVYSIYNTVKVLRECSNKNNKKNIIFSLYVQMLFVIYGFTGNTFYYYQQIAIYFISIKFLLTEIEKNKGENTNEKNRNNYIS